MYGNAADGNVHEDPQRENGWLTSHGAGIALFVLLCVGAFHASAVWGREPVVRQEAPFPMVFEAAAAATAGGTAEPVRYEVLRGDFHMHTPYSDGSVSPVDRVIEAWQYGYDAIAITDHRSFYAYEDALPVAKALGVVLLRGMETGLSGQEHLVALDFSADYQSRNEHQWADTAGQGTVFYRDQLREMARAGGFVLYAHPHVGWREPVQWGVSQGLIRGIEVKNDVVGAGWNTVYSHGTYWYPFAFAWAVEHGLTIFANSDVHGNRGVAPQAVTLVLARERSAQGVMEALLAGRTVAHFNGMLCTHEWVLGLLMASLVDVHIKETEDGKVFLGLHNRGPVALTAEIADMPLGLVTLGGYQNVLVSIRRKPDVATIMWRNLYIRPTENLVTTHVLAGTSPQSHPTR